MAFALAAAGLVTPDAAPLETEAARASRSIGEHELASPRAAPHKISKHELRRQRSAAPRAVPWYLTATIGVLCTIVCVQALYITWQLFKPRD